MPRSPARPELSLDVPLQAQPTDTSCGPTCLQAVYAYHGDRIGVDRLIEEIPSVDGGGTLAVLLGIHALKRGYRALLYTYNLRVFDPTWFLPGVDMQAKLKEQIRARGGKRREASRAYLEFLERGGEVRFEDLSASLIRKYLRRGQPILTGLSATFLYRSAREDPETTKDDDIRGDPLGHFVILKGYDAEKQMVVVADPYQGNPLSSDRAYEVPMERLINAILLGVLTYDANLLVLTREPG